MDGPVFILGTGRCGSTLLSNLLRDHPHVLSVSEFFTTTTDLGGRIARSFPEEEVDGEELWRIVADVPPKLAMMMRHGVAMEEVLYRPGPGRRFTAEGGVPGLMQTSLPHLSAEADLLFDELAAWVGGLGAAPIGAQYSELFGWLARRFGKRMWVERSGGSLRLTGRLRRAFPGARFVHLIRDGRDCAISMSRHLGFRMALVAMQLTEVLGVDPYESPDRTWEADLPEEWLDFLPERFDGAAFRRYETPLPLCGHYWSGEVTTGMAELADLPGERLLSMRYEDLLAAPGREIERLAAFLGEGMVDAGWVVRGEASVRAPRSTWRDLPARELRELERACEPGFAALAAVGG